MTAVRPDVASGATTVALLGTATLALLVVAASVPTFASASAASAEPAQSPVDSCERADVADRASHGADRAPDARIEWLVPSPPTRGDDGEAVAVAFDAPTDGRGWHLVDDAGHEARLSNRTLSGTVVLSPEPDAAARASVDAPVEPLDGRLALADGGDGLRLVGPNGSVADCVAYERAPDGERYVATDDGWRWRHPGATAFEPTSTRPDAATAFVLPDSPALPVETLRSAEDRVLLAGYTLTSDRVVDALVERHEAGVAVEVLVEGSPVGGTSEQQVDALDRLHAAGVNVTVLAGERRRYDVHHPKYAVVDDRALVLTENWKPAGVGGQSSRGWGVRLRDAEFAAALADVFRADASGPSAVAWSRHRETVDPVAVEPARGRFPSTFEPASVPVERATLVVAPDNAEAELTGLLRSANESIRIQQVRIDGLDDPLLSAALDAARNGTEVQIALSSAWYAEDQNRELVGQLRERAKREELPVSVDLIDPRGAFEKNHAKGVIVDDRYVVVGSLNWNPSALRENREAMVVLEGEAVASYYADVFAADRSGERAWRTPVGLAVAVGIAWLALGAVVATRVRWRR